MQARPKFKGSVRLIVVCLLGALLSITTLGIVVFRSLALQSRGNHDPSDTVPIFFFVYLSAVLGSAVNESSRARPELDGLGWVDRLVYLVWKMLIAIVFALVLYVGFAGGIIQGALFPRFGDLQDADYQHMMDFLDVCKPQHNRDVAKMMFWAFIGGYMERFVPNLISSRAAGTSRPG